MILFLLIGYLGCIILGTIIGKANGRAVEGFFLSALIGPLGVIITAFIPEKGIECPECKEDIKKGAIKCKHCGAYTSKTQILFQKG